MTARLSAFWNPIGVPDEIASNEYESYALTLCGKAHRGANLVSALVEALNEMGVDPDSLSASDLKELAMLSRAIQAAVDSACE